jgi:Protein of unknown function (DUF1580)
VSIDLYEETLVSLAEAVCLLPGRRPHSSTLWRWYRRGVHGVRLETVVVGGRRFTSRAAIERFIQRTTAARNGATASLNERQEPAATREGAGQ